MRERCRKSLAFLLGLTESRSRPRFNATRAGGEFRRFGKLEFHAPVAQWIEQLPSKQLVAGSSPVGRATFFLNLKPGFPMG